MAFHTGTGFLDDNLRQLLYITSLGSDPSGGCNARMLELLVLPLASAV
jgi:hypothetical protein